MNTNLLFIVGIFAVAYLFLIRPQMKEKKEFEKLLASLKKGDKVLLNSGMYAEVAAVKDDGKLTLKVADSVKIDFTKTSVAKILNQSENKA